MTKMITIDKVRAYLRSISNSEEEYNKLLDMVYINPDRRNKPCIHPECECAECPINYFKDRFKKMERKQNEED